MSLTVTVPAGAVTGQVAVSVDGYVTSRERASINADGTLGAFGDAGVNLGTLRNNTTLAVIGNYFYVVGGQNSAGALGSVERAAINADGTLGAFATPMFSR